MKQLFCKLRTFTAKLWDTHPVRMNLILSLLVTFVVECLNRRSIAGAGEFLFRTPTLFAANMLIVSVTLCLAAFGKRRTFWTTLVSVLWLLLGLTDFVMLGMRTTPFSTADFLVFFSCLPIINKYLKVWQMILIVLGLAAVVTGFVLLHKKCRVHPRRLRGQALFTAVTAGVLAGVLTLCFSLGMLSIRFPDMGKAYRDYGFSYCFSAGTFTRGVKRPADYSAETMDRVAEGLRDPETGKTVKANVIFLQLESFFDVNRLEGITYSENPVPVFSSMKENDSSGFLSVPSVGAGTANVEFEIITGMNLDHFGAGEYPYKTVLRSHACETVCTELKELGYTAHAIHNNSGTFYDRDSVFASLGFDTFTSLEYMENVEYNPIGWAKDSCLSRCIIECLGSTAGRDMIYAISVQGHGSYPEDDVEAEGMDTGEKTGGHLSGKTDSVLTQEEIDAQTIDVYGFEDPDAAAQWKYYVNQIHEMDAFVGELTEALDHYGEPVVLVVYGDHLPALSITDDMLNDGSTVLDSEYVIWMNVVAEAEHRDFEAYQLTANVLERLGISGGLIGRLHITGAESETYQDDLAALEYDMLYGDRDAWGGAEFEPSDLKMGIRPVTVNAVTVIGGDTYVVGSRFTPFTELRCNGKPVEFEEVVSGMLKVEGTPFEEGDEITAAQVCETGKTLSESEPYICGWGENDG